MLVMMLFVGSGEGLMKEVERFVLGVVVVILFVSEELLRLILKFVVLGFLMFRWIV